MLRFVHCTGRQLRLGSTIFLRVMVIMYVYIFVNSTFLCRMYLQKHIRAMHEEVQAQDDPDAPLHIMTPLEAPGQVYEQDETEREGRRSPSQMTDASSRGSSPRPAAVTVAAAAAVFAATDDSESDWERHPSKMGVTFNAMDGRRLDTIASMSADDDDTITTSPEHDVPSLCVSNIRAVHQNATVENKYHVRNCVYYHSVSCCIPSLCAYADHVLFSWRTSAKER